MMIPWCFAHDKVNYARYLTSYFAQMTNLAEKNPEVQRAFTSGSFYVQLNSNNPFGRIPVDQRTEVTVNKDTQTPGGTNRFGLNYKPATVRTALLHNSRIPECILGKTTTHGQRKQLSGSAYRASKTKDTER